MTTDSTPVIEDGARNVTLGDRVQEILKRQEVTLVGVILVFGIIITVLNPVFATPSNILDLFRATVVYFVAACGLTLVVVAGGFDFSVGSAFTLGAIGATWLMTHGVPWPVAALGGVALGFVVGLINSVIIDRLRVPPIITTLGMFYFIAGAVVLFTGGRDIQPLPDGFNAFGKGTLLGIPVLIWYAVAIGIIFHIVLQHTRFGYNVKAVGGNLDAAVANGISRVRTNAWLYAVGGAIAALAGILYSARTGSGQVSAGGSTVTLTAISAVLIGGTSLFGGVGSIAGTALGALLFATIQNGLAIASVPAQYSNMIIGAILVIAVAVDSYRRRRSLLKLLS